MGIAAAITAGAAVIGTGASIIQGGKAARAQKEAADQQVALQREQYNQTRTDNEPWRRTGASALSSLARAYGVDAGPAPTTAAPLQFRWGANGIEMVPQTAAPAPASTDRYGGFYASPGYQFRLDEGMKAIERRASANGQRFAGSTVKALGEYIGNDASQEFGRYTSGLAGLAGVGQAANGQNQQAGQSYANNAGNAIQNAGNARASAYQNTGNAITGGVQNIASAYLYGKGYGGNNYAGGYSTPYNPVTMGA
jgi:hypothetical protein